MAALRSSSPTFRAAMAAALLSALAGLGIAGGLPLAGRIPGYWVCVTILCFGSASILLVSGRGGRFLEPLPIVAAIVLFSFGARSFQLAVSLNDLPYWHPAAASANPQVDIRTSELSRFVRTRDTTPIDDALARAALAAALFMGAVVLGYASGLGRRMQTFASRVGQRASRPAQPPFVLFIFIGLAGQALVYAKLGGPAAALQHIGDQANLKAAGLRQQVLVSFGVVGLLLWGAWAWPQSRGTRVLFLLTLAELMAFYATLGSRALILRPLVLVIIIRQFVHKRWSLRSAVVGVAVVLLASIAYLGFREGSYASGSSSGAVSNVAKYMDPRAVLNDNESFDALIESTIVFGNWIPFANGAALPSAVREYLPRRVVGSKPEADDIMFRKVLWGDNLQAGRPFTLVGEFYRDKGLLGVGLGGLIFGMFLRFLLGLVRGGVTGRAARVSLYACFAILLYETINGVYSTAIGAAIPLLLPLAVAFAGFRSTVKDRALASEAAV